MSGPSLVLAVPCFDEAARLPHDTLLALVGKRPTLHLLLVDDGSRDGTLALLERLAAAAPEQVSVLALPRNRGKGEAVRAGLLSGLARRPRFVGFWDADLATPLEAVDALVAHLERHPAVWMAMGSRVRLLGGQVERGALRHGLGRAAATAAAWLVGEPVYDTQCGAKLLRVGPHIRPLLEEPFLTRWTFDVELLLRIAAAPGGELLRWPLARRVHEVPLSQWREVGGSHLGVGALLRLPVDLLRIGLRYGRGGRRGAR